MSQTDPAIVRAVLAKHADREPGVPCETCVVAAELADEQQATLDYAAECRRVRNALRRLADSVQPGRGYSGDWIAHIVGQILDGTD